MATKNNRPVPARAVHPGEILREELLERGIKQKDFAQQIGVHVTYLNEFIKGKRDLDEDLAMKLEKSLGIPFKTWMSLHSGYVYDCPLTPGILTEAGWKAWYTGSYTREIDNGRMEIVFNNIGELSIFYNPYIKLKALDPITVGEFNTLLDIVGLKKFKV